MCILYINLLTKHGCFFCVHYFNLCFNRKITNELLININCFSVGQLGT